MKIGIVGCGLVGSTAAYALVMRGIGSELVLVDKNRARSEAEADDIFHAVPFAYPLRVRAGEYADLDGCEIVIIAAGVNQQPGETRLQLLERNSAVFRQVVPAILEHAPGTILVVATNPVDVMTHLTAHYAAYYNLPSSKVIGSGTTLDTARFRALLGRHLVIDSAHVHAYVLGEHGDSEVLAWSIVSIGGIPLEEFCELRGIRLNEATRQDMDAQVRRAAYHIIQGKGATYYGIGSALARISSAILRDQDSILTVCTPVTEAAGVKDVTIALPHLVGRDGILATFQPQLNNGERQALHESAAVVRKAIDQL